MRNGSLLANESSYLGTITAPASRPGNRRANSSGTATRSVSVSRNSQRPMLLADRGFAERHSAERYLLCTASQWLVFSSGKPEFWYATYGATTGQFGDARFLPGTATESGLAIGQSAGY